MKNNSLYFKIAATEKDFHLVNEFRCRYGKIDTKMEDNFLEKEILRDKISITLIFFSKNKIVASLRYVPLGKDLSVIESIFQKFIEVEDINLYTWEASRFVIHPGYRGKGIFQECVAKSIEWMRDNTTCQRIIAPIRKKFLSLYEKYGFYPISFPELLIGRKKINYLIIMSDLMTIRFHSMTNDPRQMIPEDISPINHYRAEKFQRGNSCLHLSTN